MNDIKKTFTEDRDGIYMIVRKNVPHQALIGISMQSSVSAVEQALTRLSEALRNKWTRKTFEQITEFMFIPLCGGYGIPSLEEWLTQKGYNRVDGTIAAYINEITDKQDSKVIERIWQENRCSHSIYSGAMAFCDKGAAQRVVVPSCDVLRRIQASPELCSVMKLQVQNFLARKNESCTVYASRQVYTFEEMLATWRNIGQQAESALLDGQSYIAHYYDIQRHKANAPIIPYYAIPVAVHKFWSSNIVNVREPLDFMHVLYDSGIFEQGAIPPACLHMDNADMQLVAPFFLSKETFRKFADEVNAYYYKEYKRIQREDAKRNNKNEGTSWMNRLLGI